jgi:hypothetical protein
MAPKKPEFGSTRAIGRYVDADEWKTKIMLENN